MDQNHYLNYAVYMTSHGEYLVKVMGGFFASEAWMKSDEAYADIAGEKFGGIFGDDGKNANCSKYNIRRLASDEEFDKLYASSCKEFKFVLKCLDIFEQLHNNASDFNRRMRLYQAECKFEFETAIIKPLLEKYPDLTPEDWVRLYTND